MSSQNKINRIKNHPDTCLKKFVFLKFVSSPNNVFHQKAFFTNKFVMKKNYEKNMNYDKTEKLIVTKLKNSNFDNYN